MSAYHRPHNLMDALDLLKRHAGLKIVAGGTDTYPAQAGRVGWGDTRQPDVLDISGIAYGPRGVHETLTGWSINALTTWSDIVNADLPPLFDGLKAAAREIGGVQIQNRGTLVGNICNASPAADGIPALLALDASVTISAHDDAYEVPLDSFVLGNRRTLLKPHEIVTGICIPRASGVGAFLKLGARDSLVISIAMVAGSFEFLDDGTVRRARIAVGACSPVAQRLTQLEATLTGHRLRSGIVLAPEFFAQLTPIDDVRGSAAYRRAAARQLTRDLIARVAARAPGGLA